MKTPFNSSVANLIFASRELFFEIILKNLLSVVWLSSLNSPWRRLFSVHIKFFLFQYFLHFLNFSVIHSLRKHDSVSPWSSQLGRMFSQAKWFKSVRVFFFFSFLCLFVFYIDLYLCLHQTTSFSDFVQIVMVSPGTHLVKNQSPSPELFSPSSKNNES